MYTNTNPAELYNGTTWELITSGKYIQSGSTALSTGGSNSISIAKANLPNVKLKIDSFSLSVDGKVNVNLGVYGAAEAAANSHSVCGHSDSKISVKQFANLTKTTTGTASPYTEALGSGTAISIQPAYITLKFWKRLT